MAGRKVLIVYAHQEPKSLNGSLKTVAVEELSKQGCTVTVSDLYAMQFEPRATRNDIVDCLHNSDEFNYGVETWEAYKRGGLSDDLIEEQKKVQEADLLIFQCTVYKVFRRAIHPRTEIHRAFNTMQIRHDDFRLVDPWANWRIEEQSPTVREEAFFSGGVITSDTTALVRGLSAFTCVEALTFAMVSMHCSCLARYLRLPQTESTSVIFAKQSYRLSFLEEGMYKFPLYWFSMPAIMKGWMDRVLVQGFAHEFPNCYDSGLLKNKLALFSFTTGGSKEMYAKGGINGDIRYLLWPMQHGIMHFCGVKVLEPHICFAPEYVSEEKRKEMLLAWAQRLKTLWKEEPINCSPEWYFK